MEGRCFYWSQWLAFTTYAYDGWLMPSTFLSRARRWSRYAADQILAARLVAPAEKRAGKWLQKAIQILQPRCYLLLHHLNRHEKYRANQHFD